MRFATAKNPVVLKLLDTSEAGDFAGYAATWEIDRQHQRIARGAFANSIKKCRERGVFPPLLHQHDHELCIGAVLDAVELPEGLKVTGRLALTTEGGRAAYQLMRAARGSLSMSVAFIPLSEKIEDGLLGGAYEGLGVEVITDLDWIELSLVTVPAQSGAVVTELKSLYPDRKSFEHAARNALGLSANQAKRLAAGGWASLSRHEIADEPELDINQAAEFAKALAAVSQSLKI